VNRQPSPLTPAMEALGRFAWDEARALLARVLATGETPEALELLTQACRWTHDEAGTIDSAERAFHLYLARGDRISAARVALWLALDILEFRGQDAVANGWLRRAHRLLDGHPPAPEHAWILGVESYLALMSRNDAAGSLLLAERALAAAREVGVTDAEMVSLAVKGLALVTLGQVTEGMALLDEASTAAVHGEVDEPSARSTILCALMDACDRVRDFNRADQWCTLIREAADRWRLPPVTTVCRPHYAVVLAWRGRWEEAEAELTTAIEEYREYRPLLAVEGLVRLAELRLRQGKRDEAALLFREVEHEPLAQVGRAELALMTGDIRGAADLVARTLRRIPPDNRVERAPALEVAVRAALAAGDLPRAAEICHELRDAAAAVGTRPLQGAAAHADGLHALARGDSALARRTLRAGERALRGGASAH
jgi:LuxR family maltose regulon positive regulatory protein